MKKLNAALLAAVFLITGASANSFLQGKSASVGTDVHSKDFSSNDVYVSLGSNFTRYLTYSIKFKRYTDGSGDYALSPTVTGQLPMGNLTPYVGYSITRRLNDGANRWDENVFVGTSVKINNTFSAHGEIDDLTKSNFEYEIGVSAALTKKISVGINNDWYTKINDDAMSVQATYSF